jgi:hypothetical protein
MACIVAGQNRRKVKTESVDASASPNIVGCLIAGTIGWLAFSVLPQPV